MQMIENMEENILGPFFASKIMNIIHDDHIHGLVKINEIVDRIVLQRIYKLLTEPFAGHVYNQFIRQLLFDLITDGLHQVRFSQPDTSVDHERVERSPSRACRNRESSRSGQTDRKSVV